MNFQFDFLKSSKAMMLLSTVLVVISLVVVGVPMLTGGGMPFGLNPGLDFTGGTQLRLQFEDNESAEAVRGVLAGVNVGGVDLSSSTIQDFADLENTKSVRMQLTDEDDIDAVVRAMQDAFPGVVVISREVIGSQISQELVSSGWQSTLLVLAVILLALVTLPLLLGSWAHWLGEWSLPRSINALALLLGVGIAEELIFRAWLWRELDLLMGSASAVTVQALIFSLVHTRFNLGLGPMIGLLSGLMLLGLCLAAQRRLDGGSLWGCIGLHGGLVSGWFLLQNGLLQLSPDAPTWLVGPGGAAANPLGGAIGICGLLILLVIQLTAVARAARPATGARNAS